MPEGHDHGGGQVIHGKRISSGVWFALILIAVIGVGIAYGYGLEVGLWHGWAPPQVQQQPTQ